MSLRPDQLALALEQSEARFQSLVHRAGYGIYRSSRDGQFLDVNPALARMLGYDDEAELFALDIARDVYLDAGERDRLLAESLQPESITWFETRWKKKDGTPITVRVSVRAVCGTDGTVQSYEGIAEDITDRRRQDELLRRSERMASLGTALAGVAHELNNPLAAIMGFAQLLLKKPWKGEERIALETISHEAERSAKIVRDLLSLARRKEVNRRLPVDVNDIVGYIVRTRRYALETSGITCELQLEPSLPSVCADRAQLEQMMLNLLSNAEHAVSGIAGRGDAAGRVIIRTRHSQGSVTIDVEDNGPGLPENARDRIWDPFWTTRAEGEGTGLGLSVVHHIVDEHGGTVVAENVLPSGVCFRVRFPAGDPCSGAEATTDADHPAPRALDVLVVAPDQAGLGFLTRFLGSRGHAVLSSGDLDRARRFAEQTAFDVVVIDLGSQGGEQAMLQSLRAIPGCAAARFVVVQNAADGTASDAFAADTEVLSRPFNVDLLRRAIEAG